jgi:hypothetical protein
MHGRYANWSEKQARENTNDVRSSADLV